MNDIKTLLPQREPFLFIDALLTVSCSQIVGVKKYERDFLFRQELDGIFIVPGTILVEGLIQCGGAGLAWMGLTGDELWGLAVLERVRWRAVVEPPAVVTMKVSTHKITKRMLRQTGTGFCGDQPCLSATWCCVKFR